MANSNTRIYKVDERDAAGELDREHLVRAESQSQALKAVVTPRFKAAVATTDDVARIVGEGGKVADAEAA